ncbi:hypothetical protein [Vibrio sp. A2-1]|uniref:hypothetical protein n=1 Tax=Vibrio sp. A2-1 TaxID=2912252 RepID=UPI001F2D14BE|nr:hypothetical protein [Vibrio sp. A2-1]MCF7485434.1 hypothetical protein [Vibrio sp. A2-1]
MSTEKSCYYCGVIATSKEHVPPKCLFPESKDVTDGTNYRNKLITVPSCDLHNSAKSNDDEHLLVMLSINILNNAQGNEHAKGKVLRALKRSKGLSTSCFKDIQSVIVEDNEKKTVENTIVVKLDDERINSAIEHITKAIYFHHFGNQCNERIQTIYHGAISIGEADDISLNEINESLRKNADLILESVEVLGDNPEIFNYKILEVPENIIKFIMRFTFYGGNQVTVIGRSA